EQANLLGHAKKWKSIRDGAARGRAEVPRHGDVVQGDRERAVGVFRKRQNGTTRFEDELLCDVLPGCVWPPQWHHGQVEKAGFSGKTFRNLEQPATQKLALMRDSSLSGDDFKGVEELVCIVGTFLSIRRENAGYSDGISVQAHR